MQIAYVLQSNSARILLQIASAFKPYNCFQKLSLFVSATNIPTLIFYLLFFSSIQYDDIQDASLFAAHCCWQTDFLAVVLQ